MHLLDTLYNLCESVSKKLDACNEMIRQRGGEISNNDVELIDRLTHTMKSIKTTIAMVESDNYSKGYSSRPYNYNDGYGSSYRGRYSRDGGLENVITEMRNMMPNLPSDQRMEVQAFVERMERR